MNNRKLIGILLLVLPWAALILALSMYAVSSFVISQLSEATSGPVSMLSIPSAEAAPLTSDDMLYGKKDNPLTPEYEGALVQSDDEAISSAAGGLVRLLLGMIGVFAVLGIFIGTPVGIYLIATSSSDESAHKAGQPKPLRGQYKAFMIFAGTTVAMSAIGAVLNVYEYARLKTTSFDLTLLTDPSPVSPVTMVGSAVGGLAGLVFIISAIIYLFWLGRAARNLSLHHHLKYTPDWLVWGHIIPIYNLVHPIITYPAFWKDVASAHHAHEDELAKGQKIIIGFYIFDLLRDLSGSVTSRLSDPALNATFQFMYLANSIGEVLTVGAGIFLIMFVKMVTEKMEPQR